MNKNLRSILDDLYALDPDLRSHESELIPILERLLASKPDAEPDPAFVARLRMMLKEEASAATASRPSFFSSLLSPLSPMSPFRYTLTGVILGAVIAGPVVYGIVQRGGIPAFPPGEQSSLFSYHVQETSDEAFGDLTNVSFPAAYGRGGGGGGGGAESMPPSPDATVMQDDGVSRMLIAPEMTQYRLRFDGDLPALSDTQVDVFKRQQGLSAPAASAFLKAFDTGVIDLSSFQGAKADSVSLYQDSAYGYTFYVNFRDGSVSINSNWEKWPHPEADCNDEACILRLRPQPEDIPADDVVIGIANDFAGRHGIDTGQYGEPEVDDAWRAQYEAAADTSYAYVPDVVRVVYPLLIEGSPVYEEGGMKAGLSIGVNVRENKVSDVYGLVSQQYLKSAYEAVTDPAMITSYLENAGRFDAGWLPEGTAVNTVDVSLGTPTRGFMKMYVYEENRSDELIVPAFIFPVTSVSGGQSYYRGNVVVPLAKNLLQTLIERGSGMPMPVEPMPMPLIMEDAAR